MKHLLAFTDGGFVQAIYSDRMYPALKRMGDVLVKRASYVEPHDRGGWFIDMRPSGDNVMIGRNGARSPRRFGELLPFDTREEALAAERQWIEEKIRGNSHA